MGNSEHSFGLRLIADQPFIFSEKEIGPIISSIRRAAAENESHFCFVLFLQLVLGSTHFLCWFCFLFYPPRWSLCESRILQLPCLPPISVLVRILRSRSESISASSRSCVLLSPWFLGLGVAWCVCLPSGLKAEPMREGASSHSLSFYAFLMSRSAHSWLQDSFQWGVPCSGLFLSRFFLSVFSSFVLFFLSVFVVLSASLFEFC